MRRAQEIERGVTDSGRGERGGLQDMRKSCGEELRALESSEGKKPSLASRKEEVLSKS